MSIRFDNISQCHYVVAQYIEVVSRAGVVYGMKARGSEATEIALNEYLVTSSQLSALLAQHDEYGVCPTDYTDSFKLLAEDLGYVMYVLGYLKPKQDMKSRELRSPIDLLMGYRATRHPRL